MKIYLRKLINVISLTCLIIGVGSFITYESSVTIKLRRYEWNYENKQLTILDSNFGSKYAGPFYDPLYGGLYLIHQGVEDERNKLLKILLLNTSTCIILLLIARYLIPKYKYRCCPKLS